jgi:basic amino acid/polyamine antiporter, APA family
MVSPQPADSPQLQRVLGPWMATAIVIGTVIGSGVFKKPHAVARDLTEFGMIMIAWVLVGVLALVGSLILAEVAVIHPRAGGNYVFLREGYGRWAGFLWGWVEFWIIRSGSIAALATVFAESLHDVLRFFYGQETPEGFAMPREVLGFWSLRGITVAVIVALALVNMRGTLLGGGLQVVVTSVKVISLLGIAVLPFVCLALISDADVHTELLEPIWPADFAGIDWTKFLKAMVGIIWAYHGWMNLAPMAGEVKEPNRNLPLAFVMGTLAIIVLYCSVNAAYHLVVPRAEMADLKIGGVTPVASLFATRLLGPLGLLLASAAIMTSVFGSLNGNLLVGPRLLYAMGQDGLAPHGLCQLHSRWGTPAAAVAALTIWSVLLVLGMAVLVNTDILKKSIFDGLTDWAMFGAVSFETMAVASIFVCRRQFPLETVQLPYRCWGYPWLPIFYVTVMAAVLVNMFVTDLLQSLSALGLIVVGAIVYLLVFWRGTQAPDLERTPVSV